MDQKPRNDARELSRGWQGVLGRLELELNPHNFSTWLKGTRALRFEDGCLVVEARSNMACEWLNQRLRVVVERAATQSFPDLTSVRFVPPGELVPDVSAVPSDAPPAPPVQNVIGKVNCNFTFDGYMPGNGNILALQACRALVEPSELRVSPVVLFGSPGMGKTHLLHALACEARSQGQRVACLNAEEFANRFIGAITSGRGDDFKSVIREVDMLIIDDLQSMTTKKATLDELVHTMEAVTNSGGSIVIASERNPFELGLPERLESRLAAGIVTRVEPFRPGEQRGFIEAVARRSRTALPGWAIDRIANCPAASVRVLLGYINGAMALERSGRLDFASLDARLAGSAALDAAASSGAGPQQVLARIARHFEVAVEDLCGRSRTARLNDARAIALAAMQRSGASLTELSATFGRRDKSTIHGLCERGRSLIDADANIRELITQQSA